MRIASVVWMALLYIGLVTTTVSGAIEVSLETDAPPGSPLNLPAAGSGNVTVQAFNLTGNPSAPDDFMSGWQTTLTIVGDAGSTGHVAINSATQPTPYVFDSVGSFGLSVTISSSVNPNDTVAAFDATFSGGVDVSSGGDNLLDLGLLASGNASGLFGIFAEQAFLSEWTDSGNPFQMDHPFVNVGTGSGQVRIGEVFVEGVIPEPTSILVWSIIGLISGVMILRRRRIDA